tara:strand:- start:257 stop:790 length:534 start_codon:yes stop_codon:yes gene_type:complete
MIFIKNITKYSLYFLIILQLTSCGIYRPTDAREFPPEPEKRVQKNLDEGRGFRLFKDDNKGGVFDFASSNELWRASLDTLDFMPLISADYGGGIIITDWYNENNNYEDAIKISIRFLTNEIRSDALNIKVYTKKCENLNKCSINENNPEIQNKLVTTILSKATRYKQEKEKKSKKIN